MVCIARLKIYWKKGINIDRIIIFKSILYREQETEVKDENKRRNNK